MTIPREGLLSLLESMLLMRRVEETVCELGPKQVFGNYHIYIGQEAIGASVIAQLHPDDPIFTTHRCHAHCVARGIPLEEVMAELMLRETGASRGKGGTQHIMSRERRVVATSIVGASTTLATGAAFAAEVLGNDWITVAFLGDRSLSEGVVPEVFNLAGLWNLPVLYVCENNNEEAGYDPRRSGLNLAALTDLPQAYGIAAATVDGTDVTAVYDLAAEMIGRVRAERRPAFLEAHTPPLPGQHGPLPSLDVIGVTDLQRAWEPAVDDAGAAWRAFDPVMQLARQVLAAGAVTTDELLRLDQEIRARVERATEVARSAALPDAAQAFDGVFAGGDLWPR